jgi:hypothetical protein
MLGPFKVGPNGLISPATPTHMPSFGVRWRERLVQARISEDSEGMGTLRLTSRIGRVPSTAQEPGCRPAALGIVRDLPELLPESWGVRLAADHSIVMEARTRLALPVSAVSLVTQLSSFLLALSPYLDVLDGEGMGVGMVRT